MPIQWSGRLSSPQQLASVIQGEAGSDPAAQFAVASTMYNRMANAGPYIGGGSGDVTQVVLPSQFNGYNAAPNSNAQNLASALWAGNAPPGGSTGNATFFAAPVQGNASWAAPGGPLFQSGTNIGGNYFSDRQGAPSANFQPPSYGGAGTTLANGPADTSSGANPNTTDPLGTSVTMSPNQPSATGAAQGTPIQTGLQPEEVSQIGTWITGIENSFGAGTKAVISAAETGAATWLGSVQNWFSRAGLILLGVILIAIALIVVMWDHGGKETIVNMGKAAA